MPDKDSHISVVAEEEVDEGEAVPTEYGEGMADPYEVEMTSVQARLEEILPAELIRILKRISYELAVVGLSEEQACLLTNYPHEKLTLLRKQEPLVDRLIEMKKLSYEREILKNLSRKGKTDDKLGQWLLEQRNPGKYNRRKGTGRGGDEDDGEDLLAMALEYVQEGGEKDPLVNKKSGRAFVIKKGGGGNKPLSLEQFLA